MKPWSRDYLYWVLRTARKNRDSNGVPGKIYEQDAYIPDENDAELLAAAPELRRILHIAFHAFSEDDDGRLWTDELWNDTKAILDKTRAKTP